MQRSKSVTHERMTTVPDLALQRLHSQQLAKPKNKQPADVVARLGALQAQDYAGMKWSVGLRVPGLTEAEVEQAIDDRKILRTWAMRGTLHVVSPADIRWMLELLAPRIIAGNARRYKQLELDNRTFVRSNDIIGTALEGRNQLDRPALVAILEKRGIPAAGQRAPYLLQRAALDRLIFQGVMRGKDATFLLLDEAIPEVKILTRPEALAELAMRYFTSRGPATVRDFIWWSGLSRADANLGLDSIRSALAEETFEGQVYWMSRSPLSSVKSSNVLHLLPGFDEFLLSYKDRSVSMDVKQLRSLTPANGMLPPTMVMNGKVIGIWNRTFRKGIVVIVPKPFGPLNAEQKRRIIDASERYGAFLGMSVDMAG